METSELIRVLVTYCVGVGAPVAGATIWGCNAANKRADVAKVKIEAALREKKMDMELQAIMAKENSAGASAIKELVEADKHIVKEMHEIEERFEGRDNETRGQLQNITQQIQQFTLQAISLLSGNKK